MTAATRRTPRRTANDARRFTVVTVPGCEDVFVYDLHAMRSVEACGSLAAAREALHVWNG